MKPLCASAANAEPTSVASRGDSTRGGERPAQPEPSGLASSEFETLWVTSSSSASFVPPGGAYEKLFIVEGDGFGS